MKFNRINPPDHLKSYVQYFWTLEGEERFQDPQALGPLADGCPGLIFQPLEAGSFYDDEGKRLAEVFLYGQTITRTAIYLVGSFRMVGVCFYPDALKPVFGFNAIELTDTCIDVDLMCQVREGQLSEKLLTVPTSKERIDIICNFLWTGISKHAVQQDLITRQALSEIIDSGGQVSLPMLQKKFNLSERTFERRFNSFVGITPKLFSRVCKFQASLNQLKTNQYSRLSDIAFDNGFTDQSHFIRTFREFTGITPEQFQKQSAISVPSTT
jgi:AraC-like DNA-binding protein